MKHMMANDDILQHGHTQNIDFIPLKTQNMLLANNLSKPGSFFYKLGYFQKY